MIFNRELGQRARLWILISLALTTALGGIALCGTASTGPAWPLQLEMHVPFEPTAFPSDGHTYLIYELYLTNFTMTPLSLRRIDVVDADNAASAPIAGFEALKPMLQHVAGQEPTGGKIVQIGGGETVVVFLSIAFDKNTAVPRRLMHRVVTTEGVVEGAIVGTHHNILHVLGPPLNGGNWFASDGPGNEPDNHHRREILIVDGRAVISERYAIDWEQVERGNSFSGDVRDVHSYYAYGKSVLAVAEGRVVTARDGLPDNVPGHNAEFHPAVPVTMDTVGGNTITLDLGGGQFAYYFHLQHGSLRVKVGDQVRRGQVIARVGCSGDAREPHLHFEVTTSSKTLAGEGVPYLMDQYRLDAANGGQNERKRELPLDNSIVTFGDAR